MSLIIAIIAVIYTFLSIRRSNRREEPDAPYEEEDEYDYEEEEVVVPPPPPPKQKPKQVVAKVQEPQLQTQFKSTLDNYATATAIDDRHLDIHLRKEGELISDKFRLLETEGVVVKQKKKPTIRELIKELPEDKLLFLSYEVFSRPVCKRKSPFPWDN